MNRPYTQNLAINDCLHLKMAYVNLHDALNELSQVYAKDKIITRIYRELYTMEDQLFEYAIPRRDKR